MDPGVQARIRGAIGAAPMGEALNRLVTPANPCDGLFDFGHGAEGCGSDVRRGPGQATQRVVPVVGVVKNAGGHLGVGGLDQKSPDSADEHRGIADHRPGR